MRGKAEQVSGRVAFVQESRMTVIDDVGVARLFVLGHSSLAEPSQLTALQRSQARVRVTFQDAPDLVAHIATAIEVE